MVSKESNMQKKKKNLKNQAHRIPGSLVVRIQKIKEADLSEIRQRI